MVFYSTSSAVHYGLNGQFTIDEWRINVYIRVYPMPRDRNSRKRITKRTRKGVPLMVYLKDGQAKKLRELSSDRRITKTALVQFAVDRLFAEMANGQLELPLGLDAGGS